MGLFASALAGAVGAATTDLSAGLSDQMKQDSADAAAQRAANLQLDLHQRMAAADELQRNAAAQRFADLTKQKMGEQVPVQPSDIKNPSLTDASAVEITPRTPGATPAAGSSTAGSTDASAGDDGEDDDSRDASSTPAPGGAGTVKVALHGDQSATLKQMQAVVDNPKATAEQKQDAQNVIDGIKAQTAKQQQLDAAGKTRNRTLKEARDAAFEATAQDDPAAYIAGQSMWKQAMANDREDASDEDKKQEKAADRTSREKIAGMNIEQRNKASADRLAAAKARIEALSGGKGAKATALMQNYKFMTEQMGKTPDEAQRLLFQAKDSSELDKAFKLLIHDKYSELSVDDALGKVRGLEKAAGVTSPAPSAPSAPSGKQMATGGRVRNWNPTTGKFE